MNRRRIASALLPALLLLPGALGGASPPLRLPALPEETPPPRQAAPVSWQLPEARFRLTVFRDRAGVPFAVEPPRLLLPETVSGVRVLDEAGRPLPFLRTANGTVLLAGGRSGRAFCYFGFAAPPPDDCWDRAAAGPPPGEDRLRIRIVNGGALAAAETDWMQKRLEQTQLRLARVYLRNLVSVGRYTLALATAPDAYLLRSSELWLLLQQHRAKRQLERDAFLRRLPVTRPMRPMRLPWYAPIAFRPLQQRYLRDRLIGIFRQLQDLPRRCARDLERLTREVNGAPEREMIALFRNPRAVVRGDGPVRQVDLPKRPFDSDGNLAVRYAGKLWVEADDAYEFAATSNSLTVLRLDNRTVLSRFGIADPASVRPETCRVRLTRGLHDFELYYLKSRVTTTISAAWRRVGEPAFRPLAETDFRAARPAEVLALEGRDGERYPVVERDDGHWLHTGKRTGRPLSRFRVRRPADLAFDWRQGDRRFPGGALPVLAEPAPGDPPLRLVPHDAGWSPLPVLPAAAAAPRVSVEPELALSVRLPDLLYDDESADCTLEIHSRLALPVCVALECRGGRDQLPSGVEFPAISGKPRENFDRFAADRVWRRRYRLSIGKLLPETAVEFRLSIPTVEFDRLRLRFCAVDRLPDGLQITPDGLFAGDERIIPVLARPTLGDQRRWELLRTVRDRLVPPRRQLVAGENFGTGDDSFGEALTAGGATRFIDWLPGEISGSRLLDSLPRLLDELGRTDAERVVLIPPPRSRDRQLAAWERRRLLALLIERARRNPRVRVVELATPLPAAADSAEDAAWERELRELAREYGISLLEFGSGCRRLPDWADRFLHRRTDGVWRDSRPVRGGRDAAARLTALQRR